MACSEEATEGLFLTAADAHPCAVAEEIVRLLDLPAGERPLRTVVDFGQARAMKVTEVIRTAQEQLVTRLDFGDLLHVKPKN